MTPSVRYYTQKMSSRANVQPKVPTAIVTMAFVIYLIDYGVLSGTITTISRFSLPPEVPIARECYCHRIRSNYIR